MNTCSTTKTTTWRPFAALLLGLALVGLDVLARELDLKNGEEINEVCAGCHGEYGQGGSEGKYPRLSGQPADYIAQQVLLFRDRKRPNIPMIEHVDARQLPDKDVADVSGYLATIKLKTKLPPADESDPNFDAYARLLESKKLMQIPRSEGDLEKGEKLYKKECDTCHGREGWGDVAKGVPMLAGQYTDYLWRQVEKYLNGIRIHDPESPNDELLKEFSQEEIRDIFAFMSIADD